MIRLNIHLLSFIFLFNTSFADELAFDHLTVENGLPTNTIYDITQDTLGFIWLATRNDLTKYDGFEFTIYKSNENDSMRIIDNNIYCIYEDRYGLELKMD